MADALAGAVAPKARPTPLSSMPVASRDASGGVNPLESTSDTAARPIDVVDLSSGARTGATGTAQTVGRSAAPSTETIGQPLADSPATVSGPLADALMDRFREAFGGSLASLFRSMGPDAESSWRSAFQSINDALAEISRLDSEMASRLDVLFRTLDKFSDRIFDRGAMLRQLDRTIGGLLNAMTAGAEPPAMPAGAPAGPPPGTPPSADYFVFELEFTETVNVEATVTELTDQGFRVSRVNLEQTTNFRLRVEYGEPPAQAEPLVLDLDGDGVNLTGFEDGVRFDIDGDGVEDQTAFAREGDGVLALDRNENGRIDDGRELFGDQHGAANGFEELSKFDDNADGVIDRRDSVYASLGVVRDANADGRLDPGEFMSLASLDIASISLENELVREDDGRGNTLAERGHFVRTDGSRGQAVDAWFGYRPGRNLTTEA